MTDPADLDSIQHAVSLQGATIGRHEELLQDLLEGLNSLTEHHDQGFKGTMELIKELTHRLSAIPENPQSPFPFSGELVQPTPVPQEPCLPPPERHSGNFGTCQGFLSQCSLIFELQLSSFPSDRLKIAYIITLMSGRVLSWAMAVWEQ